MRHVAPGIARALLVASCMVASACRSVPARSSARDNVDPSPGAGHLLIMGGAIHADNEEVYSHFMAPLPFDAVIGVIPTASASPKESAEASVATLRRYASTRQVVPLDISLANASRASDPEFIDQLSRCNAVFFTGGDQSRVTAVFRPPTGDTPAVLAMRELLGRGGVIGGTSAGAAMMSDPMITGGRSDDALLGKLRAEGDDSGFGVNRRMGFFTGGLTDQHFLRRGRLGRLIVALEITGSMYGYGVEENSALDVDLRARTITALGPGPAAVVVDISGMERVGAARRNVRVSLLRSGDVVRLDDRRIFPRNSNASMPPRESAPEEGQGLPGAWSAGAVTIALDRLARNRTTPVELHSNAFDLRFSADERTRFLSDKGTVDQVTACDVRLDITPRTETRE